MPNSYLWRKKGGIFLRFPPPQINHSRALFDHLVGESRRFLSFFGEEKKSLLSTEKCSSDFENGQRTDGPKSRNDDDCLISISLENRQSYISHSTFFLTYTTWLLGYVNDKNYIFFSRLCVMFDPPPFLKGGTSTLFSHVSKTFLLQPLKRRCWLLIARVMCVLRLGKTIAKEEEEGFSTAPPPTKKLDLFSV